jgi:hypothetical protein
MEIKNIILILLALAVIGFAVKQDVKLGAVTNQIRLVTCTNTTSTVATSGATTILAGNSARQYVSINVASTSPAVYLNMANSTATAAGTIIQAGGRYEITQDNFYNGVIKALPVGGTAGTVYITECTE